MSRVFLVRHGQAAFGTDDYDRLTATGIAQCRQLASHWRAIGRGVDRVYSGTLRRQRESAETFARAIAATGADATPVRLVPGFEEYDHRGLLTAMETAAGAPATSLEPQAFHRQLAAALRAWAAGELQGVEPYPVFRDRCAAALAALLKDIGRGSSAVLFGSAGSLAAAMQPVLGLGDRELLRWKLCFYNSGVSSLLFDDEAITIETVNAISHLERPEFTHLITHR